MTTNEIISQYDFTKIPFDRIVRFGQRTLLYHDLFNVSWILGRFCNYSCSYCWPYARSDEKDHRSTDLCIRTMDEIKLQARERDFNSFHFSFSGGEPTLHPGLLDILAHYSADLPNVNYQSTHLTTNLSPGMRWWDKYIDATRELHRVSITASWHREQGIKQGDLHKHMEKFADKLVHLQANDVYTTINMVMVPDMFEELWEEALYFHDRQINVTLKPQSDPTASHVVHGYTDSMIERLHRGMPQRDYVKGQAQWHRPRPTIELEQVRVTNGDAQAVPSTFQVELEDDEGHRWYMDQAERFNAFGFNKFAGWLCESGYRSVVIREPDGSIKRSYSCHDKPLGNIETGFRLFDSPTPCVTPSCVSSVDSKIPKHKV